MLESFRGLRKFSCAPALSCGIEEKYHATTKRTKATKGSFYSFKLRALCDLCGEISPCTLVAATPRWALRDLLRKFGLRLR
jgi:hypothetical protein